MNVAATRGAAVRGAAGDEATARATVNDIAPGAEAASEGDVLRRS